MLILRVEGQDPKLIQPSAEEEDQKDLEREVAGEYNTLRVYLFMLKTKVSSARDVQTALEFSSPSLAHHHLEKLSKYGLVVKNYDGTYRVKSRSFGFLKLYVKSGKWLVPRTLFFVIIFLVLSIGFLLSIPQHRFFWIAAGISIVGLAYAVYETIRAYKVLPRT